MQRALQKKLIGPRAQRELLAFLQSDLAIDLYRKYGFTVLKTYAAQP